MDRIEEQVEVGAIANGQRAANNKGKKARGFLPHCQLSIINYQLLSVVLVERHSDAEVIAAADIEPSDVDTNIAHGG